MASTIGNWLLTTVRIQNQWGGVGSGFLIFRETCEDLGGKFFLVTNKHVIHPNCAMRRQATQLWCHFITRTEDWKVFPVDGIVLTHYYDGKPSFREHPDPDTDVYVVDATAAISAIKQQLGAMPHAASYSDFADTREELDITVAEEILVIGYPLGLTQGEAGFTLVRQGILATDPRFTIKDEIIAEDQKTRAREIRAFLIDGATIPGSSGSPVILKPVVGRMVKGTFMTELPPSVLLGIIAETMYAPIRAAEGSIPGFAGLGLAFHVITVRETIEQFF